MVSREDFVQEARTWIGTRFVKGQRTKGAGVDCALPLFLIEQYTGRKVDCERIRCMVSFRKDSLHEIMSLLCGGEPEKVADPLPGDILTLYFDRDTRHAQHCAIVTDIGMLHCMESTGVIEHDLNQNWVRKIVSCYRNPAIEE